MKFDINNYKGNYAMHCKTFQEAIEFCDYLHKIGRKWCDDTPYIHNTNWYKYKEKTCYSFNKGSYGSLYGVAGENNTILEWSDFTTEFTKADLKDGMVVEYANGNRRVVLGKHIIELNGRHAPLSDYTEDLREPNFPDQTINKVYTSSALSLSHLFCDDNLTLIWERKEEPVEMTLEEVCKALGKEIKIVKG